MPVARVPGCPSVRADELSMTHNILLQIAVMLIAAKVGGEICERWLKQPAVLGEIVFGVLVGVSCMRVIDGADPILVQMAEIGGVLLLFEVGLETDVDELFRVGFAAMWVAVVGVCLPFLLGFAVMRALHYETMQAIFVGAALTATSVGITARVFSDLRMLQSEEARIVLGAAVIDDVIGLIILAAVSGMAVTKEVSWSGIGKLTLLAIAFLVGAIVIGTKTAPYIFTFLSRMRTRAAISSGAVILCLIMASMAETVRLAPIVGAFAAGIILAKAEHKLHFERRVKSIADIFIPIFFVMMGARMQVQLFNPVTSSGRATLLIGLALLAVGTLGKVLGGLTLPGKFKRLTIGIGMIPRGEVGLIFASIGLSAGVISPQLYAAIILVVILTTFVTPPLLKGISTRGALYKGPDASPVPNPSEATLEINQGEV